MENWPGSITRRQTPFSNKKRPKIPQDRVIITTFLSTFRKTLVLSWTHLKLKYLQGLLLRVGISIKSNHVSPEMRTINRILTASTSTSRTGRLLVFDLFLGTFPDWQPFKPGAMLKHQSTQTNTMPFDFYNCQMEIILDITLTQVNGKLRSSQTHCPTMNTVG